MKEFIKKCPFVFSLIISGFLVFDFYMVENDYLKIMPEGSNRVTMSESEEILHDKEGDTTLSDELDRDKVPDISQDPLLWREPDNSTNDNSIEQDHSGEQQNFGEQNKSQEQQNAEKNKEIKDKIDELEKEFSGNGRVLIRPSGTEPLVRVMLEGEDKEYIYAKAKELAMLIEEKLK